MSEDLWRWRAHQPAAAVRNGTVSAHEALASSLERVQAVIATEDSPVAANLRKAGAVARWRGT